MYTILVVDDDPCVRELVNITFESRPYRILEAECACQALKLAYDTRPDLMLLDVLLPDNRSGLEVCSALKADQATRSIRIIMLSAMAEPRDIELGHAAGADGYLTKPFRLANLIRTVEGALSWRRLPGS